MYHITGCVYPSKQRVFFSVKLISVKLIFSLSLKLVLMNCNYTNSSLHNDNTDLKNEMNNENCGNGQNGLQVHVLLTLS